MLLCMFVGTAWAQPTAGTVYFLKDKHGTYLDLHNLGQEANDKSKDQLATLSANPQNLYITATTDGDKVYWQIHTTAVGGNYLKQHPSERRWNTWVSEGTGDFKWEVEELVESDITYYKLKNISGVENGYLGTDSHTDGQPLYVNNYGDKVLKLQLIEKPANEYYFEVPDGFTVTYNGEEYTNADAFIVEGELAAEDFAVNNVPAGYKASVTVDKENNKVIVTIVIDLTAFTDGTKWVFKNKQHNTYLGVMFDGGKLDNSIAPTTSYLTGFTTNNNYKNCWELVATTYNERECFYLYNPYYDWYASPIPSRNGRIGLSKTTDGAGFFQVESKGDYIAFKCMTYADEKYQYLHQVDWRNSDRKSVV